MRGGTVRRTSRLRFAATLSLAAGFLWAGCSAANRSLTYQTIPPSILHTIESAREANAEGLRHARQGECAKAENAFRRAIGAQLHYAAAHNNLGLILLEQGRLYEAAREFAFAAKVDSRALEPLLNLAGLYEAVGWSDAAVAEYEKALQRDESSVEVMGRLASVLIHRGKQSVQLDGLLRALAEQGDHESWRKWAVAEIARVEATDRR